MKRDSASKAGPMFGVAAVACGFSSGYRTENAAAAAPNTRLII